MPRTDCDAHYFAAPLSGRCRPKRDNHPAVRRDNISKPWRGDDRAQRPNVTREGSNLRDIESSDATITGNTGLKFDPKILKVPQT